MATIDLVFLWHMHQPDYRESGRAGARFAQPWVYLHAWKDYADMAGHLEQHRGIRAVVNFSSTLLEQLEDYVDQFATRRLRDPLLELLAHPGTAPLTADERLYIGDQCLRIKRETMLRRFAAYAAIEKRVRGAEFGAPARWAEFPEQWFWDLLTWYHLAWCGETVRETSAVVRRLAEKAEGYDAADRAELFEEIGRIVAGILPRYRALADQGRIELSMTPYSHPIGPLLIDFHAAHDADPAAALPAEGPYPGGEERGRWHIQRSVQVFQRCFARVPRGMWPAEGAVSTRFLQIAAEEGVEWVGTNESILRRSAPAAAAGAHGSAWRVDGGPVMFFRAEKVSEFFGYEYAQREPVAAVNHFVGALRADAGLGAPGQVPVLSMILDGENAWEHYPANGHAFFTELYRRIAQSGDICTTTYSDWLDRHAQQALPVLPDVSAGSWVFGGFSMWIGDEARNLAWDALCTLKRHVDAWQASEPRPAERVAEVERALARCESSDWFWWMGFDEPTSAVLSFDAGFQAALRDTYAAIGMPPPASALQHYSRLGKQSFAPLDPHVAALAIAKTFGMQIEAELPEQRLSWNADSACAELDAMLQQLPRKGWAFALPDAGTGDGAAAFKYAEIKIALEKSDQRYFEGRATLATGEYAPGLLAVGVDEHSAQHLANRFRLPAVVFGEIGCKPRVVMCR